MKNGKLKKLTAGLLSAAMVCSLNTGVVFADDAGGETTLKMGIYGGLDSLNPWASGRITKIWSPMFFMRHWQVVRAVQLKSTAL